MSQLSEIWTLYYIEIAWDTLRCSRSGRPAEETREDFDSPLVGTGLPGKATPNSLGYGYLLWLLPGTRRQFAMIGILGHYVFVDPPSKLVMVQTALEDTDEVWRLWSAVVAQFGQG